MTTQAYKLTTSGWKKNLLRRTGAAVVDFAAAFFLALILVFTVQATGFVDATGGKMLGAAAGMFVFLRTLDFSLGNVTVGLRVHGSSVGKNFVRVMALLAPGYNVFDWVYAVRNPLHQTFTDMKLSVRVVDDTLR